MTRWERLGYTTSWGRYLADIENQLILRGESYAPCAGKGIDLGCGGGRWSKLLSERGWDMTCMDIDGEDLAVCQQKVPSAKCVLTQPDDTSIPALAESANIVLCIEVVPLLEAEWFPREVNRVLQNDGILIGVHINGQSYRGMASRLVNRFVNGRAPYLFYQSSYAAYRERMIRNGFEMLHEESCCWGPFGRESNSPFVPAFVKMERALRLNRVVTWGPWVAFIAQKKNRAA